MTKKFYSLIAGAALVAAGSFAAVVSGSVTLDPGNKDTYRPDAPATPTATVGVDEPTVTVSVVAPSTGAKIDNEIVTEGQVLPEGTKLTMDVYRADSEEGAGEVVYTKEADLGATVTFTDDAAEPGHYYYYYSVATDQASHLSSEASDRVKVCTVGSYNKAVAVTPTLSYDETAEGVKVEFTAPEKAWYTSAENEYTLPSDFVMTRIRVVRWIDNPYDITTVKNYYNEVKAGESVSFVDTQDLTPGVTYKYQVRTYLANSTYSNENNPNAEILVPIPKVPNDAVGTVTVCNPVWNAETKKVAVNFTMPSEATATVNGVEKTYNIAGQEFYQVVLFRNEIQDGKYVNYKPLATYQKSTGPSTNLAPLKGGQEVVFEDDQVEAGKTYAYGINTQWSVMDPAKGRSKYFTVETTEPEPEKVPNDAVGTVTVCNPVWNAETKKVAVNFTMPSEATATVNGVEKTYNIAGQEFYQVVLFRNEIQDGKYVNYKPLATYQKSTGPSTNLAPLKGGQEVVFEDDQVEAGKTYAYGINTQWSVMDPAKGRSKYFTVETTATEPEVVPDDAHVMINDLTGEYNAEAGEVTINFTVPDQAYKDVDGVTKYYDIKGEKIYEVILTRVDCDENGKVGQTGFVYLKTYNKELVGGQEVTYVDKTAEPGKIYAYQVYSKWSMKVSREYSSYLKVSTDAELEAVPNKAVGVITQASATYDAAENAVTVTYVLPDKVVYEGKEYDVTGKTYKSVYVQFMEYADANYSVYLNGGVVRGSMLNDVEAGREYTAVMTDINKGHYYKFLVYNQWLDATNYSFNALEVPCVGEDVQKEHAAATGVAVTLKDAQTLAITWNAPAGDNLEEISGYNVYVNDVKENSELLTATSFDYEINDGSKEFAVYVETVYADDVTVNSDVVNYALAAGEEIPATAWGKVTEMTFTFDNEDAVDYEFTIPNFVTSRAWVDGKPVDTNWEIGDAAFYEANVYRYEMDGPGEDAAIAKTPEGGNIPRVTVATYKDGLTAGAVLTGVDNKIEQHKFYKYYVGLKWISTSYEPGSDLTYAYVSTFPTIEPEKVYLPAADVKAALNEEEDAIVITWVAPEDENLAELAGYNVLVDGNVVNAELLTATEYTYALDSKETHNYNVAVQAVYADDKTVDSDAVVVAYDSIALLIGEDGEAAIYTLQGVRVKNPTTGLYIIVKDGKSYKVNIRR